ncbi:MAG: response regulator [Chloroflexota bacterium]
MKGSKHFSGQGRLEAQAMHWPPRGPARVLLVMDQSSLVDLITSALNHGTYSVQTATSTQTTENLLRTWQPHLVVFDADLDDRATLHLVGANLMGGARVPSIALTRSAHLHTKLAAFESGVDDILTVPFAPEELVARVLALLRRSYTDAVTFTPVIKVGELEIDILHRTVHTGNVELHLTSLEQSLLYLLASNAGRVLSREEIMDTLWGVDYVPDSNVVDRQIRNLRTQLKDDWRRPRFIATVPGRGYRFLHVVTRSTGPISHPSAKTDHA